MQQKRKKITAFLVLLLVAMPVFFSLNFMLQGKLLQEEAEKKFDTVTLQTINVSNNDLVWVREGKEVLIDGEMFDVESYTSSNGIVTLTGFFDIKETDLQHDFTKLIEHSGNDASRSTLVLKFLFFPVYDGHCEMLYAAHWQYISSQYLSYDEMIPTAPGVLFSRPPRLAA